MRIESSQTKAAAIRQPLRLGAVLAVATALAACGGSGGGTPSTPSSAAASGSSNQTAVVVTPNDPATAGPSAEALLPPGDNAGTGTSATTPPARRPETVRCAP